MARFRFTLQQITALLSHHMGAGLYDQEIIDLWKIFDDYYKKQHVIQWPMVVATGEIAANALKRLEMRVNFGKVIVNATETTVLSGGFTVYNKNGEREREVERLFERNRLSVKKGINYMSRYGAAWLQIIQEDRARPYRFHKPHVAIEITDPDDPELVTAVLSVTTTRTVEPGVGGPRVVDRVFGRWYEWDDMRREVRRLRFTRPYGLTNLVLPDTITQDTYGWIQLGEPKPFNYMPMVLCRNRVEDTIPEASDLCEAVPLLQTFDDICSKWNKALEDEAFRQTFFSGLDGEQVKKMTERGPQVWLFAKNRPEEPAPQMQIAEPSTLEQYIAAFQRLVKNIVTVTRTSPLELDERPVQDIPAQTLRILMGPQIERSQDTSSAISTPLSTAVDAAQTNGVASPEGQGWRVVLTPKIPISHEAESNASIARIENAILSPQEVLRQEGRTEAEIEKIYNEVMAHKRALSEIETAQRVAVEEVKERAALAVAETRASQPAPTTTGG